MQKLIKNKWVWWILFISFFVGASIIGQYSKTFEITKNNLSTNCKSINQSFLDKIQENNVSKLFDENYIGYTMEDITSTQKHQIKISNDNLMYKPSNLNLLKEQTLDSSKSIDQLVIKELLNRSKALTLDVNSYYQINSIKPFLERAQISSWTGNDYLWETITNAKIKYSTSSIYGYGETLWMDLDTNWEFVDKVGKSFNEFWIRENESWFQEELAFKLEFPAGYKHSKMFIPEEIEYLDNKKIKFKVGSKGFNYKEQTKQLKIGNFVYRAGYEILANPIPELGINLQNIEIKNPNYDLSLSNLNDTRYSFISLKTKNDFNNLKDAYDFIDYRKNISNELIELRNSDQYKCYINEVLSNNKNIVADQITVKSKIINQNYNIVQYEYKLPNFFENTHAIYKISDNTLSNIRQYSGIVNLVADNLVLDPNSGVKNKIKENDFVYDKSDYEQIGLNFKFEDTFLETLNLIDEYNKLFLSLKEKLKTTNLNWIQISEPIWNFSYDITIYDGNIDKLISSLQDNSWKNHLTNNVIKKIKKTLKDESSLVDNSILFFFHHLPQLFKDFYTQMSIETGIVQAGQLAYKFEIFKNNKFNTINFNDNMLKENHANISKNLAILEINNIQIKNKIFDFENLESINLQNVCRLYPENNSLSIKNTLIKYEIYYRDNYAGIKPKNGQNTKFKIDRSIDQEGVLATEYLTNKNKFNLILNTLNKNLISDKNLLEIDESGIQIITDQTKISNKLKEIIDKYEINLEPNNETGIFYAVIKIKNSNDLVNFGNDNNIEIIPKSMWFIENDNNPIIRNYLVQFEAAKKDLLWHQISFDLSNNNNLKMKIKNNNQDEEYYLNLIKDEQNNILANQELNINFLTYWNLKDNKMSNNCFATLENAFAKLGYQIFYQSVLINNYLKTISFTLLDGFSKIELKNNVKEKSIDLIYENNEFKETKYQINYEIIKTNDNFDIKISLNKELTTFTYNLYIQPYANAICEKLLKIINEDEQLKFENLKIINLEIDFLNQKIKFDIIPTNENFEIKSENSNNNLSLILGITIPTSIIFFVMLMVCFYKKRKNK
ncbi:hypothetical protein [Mycoplasmoides pirum]|uniref:hypothetical protein n=1 Tax=Mycoplasmoides pirum TaxID=2122 RepID=UPI000484930B|nr:hypothetical protein [Mycoplasmoides pirum]